MSFVQISSAALVGGLTALPAYSQTSSPGDVMEQVSSVGVSLIVVLGLIIAVAWLLRRSPLASTMRSRGPMRILASLAVGPRERIVLIEAGEQRLIVGVSPAGMFRLGDGSQLGETAVPRTFERILDGERQ